MPRKNQIEQIPQLIKTMANLTSKESHGKREELAKLANISHYECRTQRKAVGTKANSLNVPSSFSLPSRFVTPKCGHNLISLTLSDVFAA